MKKSHTLDLKNIAAISITENLPKLDPGEEVTIYSEETGQTVCIERLGNGFKIKLGSVSADLLDDGKVDTKDCKIWQ